jgi:hypothetical protein
VPEQAILKKVEGSSYLYEGTYSSGTKRYFAKVTRGGKAIKQAFPFTPQGKKDAIARIDTFLKNLDPADLKKADAAIRQGGDGKWRYVRPDKPVEIFNTKAEAEAFQKEAKRLQYEKMTKLPKSDFPKIKKRIIAGETLDEIAKTYKLKDVGNIRGLLAANNTTYSQLTPHVSYRNDPELRKLLKADYGKLSRTSLAKKLFPDLPFKTADARTAHLIQQMSKDGEIKLLEKGKFADEVTEKFSKEPLEVQKRKVSAQRAKKLTKLGSKPYEIHLQQWKRNLQESLGLPKVKDKFYPIDLAHRSDIDQLKRLNTKLNPSDIGPDYYRANREGIRKFKDGVKTLERKLKPLYVAQKNLFKHASKFDIDKIPELLKNKINKNNIAITELVADGIGGRIKPITINVDTLEILRGNQNVMKTLGMGIIDKDMSDIQFPNRANNFVGSVDDATIKMNLAQQISDEAVANKLISPADAANRLKAFWAYEQGSNAQKRYMEKAVNCSKGCFVQAVSEDPSKINRALASIKNFFITKPDMPSVKYDDTLGAFVDTKTDNIASQAELKTWADDNPMEVKVGEAKPGILRKTGKALAHIGLPLPTAAMDAYFIGRQVEEGKSPTEIAKDPFNWLGLATMEPLTKGCRDDREIWKTSFCFKIRNESRNDQRSK